MNIVFDFDGTLCDITHRLHFIQNKPKDWPAFFRACANDPPIMEMVNLASRLVLAGNRVEVWSGRSDIVRRESDEWLTRHCIGHALLRMRKDGDYRQDAIVKAEWLEALPKHDWPDVVFDDRQQVVDMWRAHGVRCCQVAPGDF